MSRNTAPIKAVCCWGDSMTDGSGATSTTTFTVGQGPYPFQLGALDRTRPVTRRGYPSQNAAFVAARFAEDPVLGAQWTAVIWIGTNNIAFASGIDDVMSAAQSMVSRLGHERYIFVSPHAPANLQTGNVWNQQRSDMQSALSAAYPGRVVDSWGALLAAGPVGNSTDGGSSVGTVHSSFRADALHLNDAGYAIVAEQVNTRLAALGF